MKEFFNKLRPHLANPIVLIGLGLLPPVLALTLFFSRQSSLSLLEKRATYLHQKKTYATEKKKAEEALLTRVSGAPRDYVERELETLQFLQLEQKKLRALVHADPHNDKQSQRLQFLAGGVNSLRFKQQNFKRFKAFGECELIQDHPVEMDQDDLMQLLARIDGINVGSHIPSPRSPQLIVKQLDLKKKSLSSNEETYVINLQLIKREMLHE
ncbi:MAG: hypothetical protein KR126chlam1_00497 [Chlamydiae bacterium]|nr:hypothetical protein [Chlamydiota bacterium]